MRKLMLTFALATMLTTNVLAQEPWKTVDMEYVTQYGNNCAYDDETCTATFKGVYGRWLDIPELSGDLTKHKKMSVTVMKSNVILSFNILYRDADGNKKQVSSQTLYSSMARKIDEKKTFKVDLSDRGKISDEILENVICVRISMAKQAEGADEPWFCQFDDIVIE